MDLPVIDFAECGLLHMNDNDVKEESLCNAGIQLYRAFSEVGFAYVTNSGIPNKLVEKLSDLSDKFFSLPLEEKNKYCNRKLVGVCYDPNGSVRMYKDRPPENFEGFRMLPYGEDPWPNIPELKENSIYFQGLCKILILRLLKALGRGMKLKDVDHFSKLHKFLNMKGNVSQMKFNLFPAIFGEVEKGSLRLTEQSNFGSLPLLFHGEDEGICGLQAEVGNEKYANINQVPHGVLLTVGDQLKLLTGGRLRSVKHRVIVPEDEKMRSKARKSILYAAHVDNDALLTELEFEDTRKNIINIEKPMTGKEYIEKTYKDHFY